MKKRMVIEITGNGVHKVMNKWISESMTCNLIVSRSEHGMCRITIVYDSENPANLRTLLLEAKCDIIGLK